MLSTPESFVRHWWKGVAAMVNISRHFGIRRKKPKTVLQDELAFTEAVRSHSYELYESRGREDGHDLDDWLLAEQQVLHLFCTRETTKSSLKRFSAFSNSCFGQAEVIAVTDTSAVIA